MARSRTFAAVALAAALLGGSAAPASAAIPGCPVTDATLTWGFKESFRAYIDGDIANGEWTTADGATYDTPAFSWHGGSGVYDPSDGTGLVAFSGSVRFTGHDGLLDTTIADPQIRFDGDSAMLLLDVSGPTMDGTPTDFTAVEFVALPSVAVVGEDATRTMNAATELTEDGAVAFPNYAAGEAFDPIELAIDVGKTCPVAASDAVADEDEFPWGVLAATVVVLVVVATVAATFLLTRRRRA